MCVCVCVCVIYYGPVPSFWRRLAVHISRSREVSAWSLRVRDPVDFGEFRPLYILIYVYRPRCFFFPGTSALAFFDAESSPASELLFFF